MPYSSNLLWHALILDLCVLAAMLPILLYYNADISMQQLQSLDEIINFRFYIKLCH